MYSNLKLITFVLALALPAVALADGQSGAAPTAPTIEQLRAEQDALNLHKTKIMEQLRQAQTVYDQVNADDAFLRDYMRSSKNSLPPVSILAAEHPIAYTASLLGLGGGTSGLVNMKLVPWLLTKGANNVLMNLAREYPLYVKVTPWLVTASIAVYKSVKNYDHYQKLVGYDYFNADENRVVHVKGYKEMSETDIDALYAEKNAECAYWKDQVAKLSDEMYAIDAQLNQVEKKITPPPQIVR